MPIKKTVQWLLRKPVSVIAERFSSKPVREKVHAALTKLYTASAEQPGNKNGNLIVADGKPVIIFSDHHKGARNGSDDFAAAEQNYLAALEYYNSRGFYYINLGDSEELWENTIFSVMKHNTATFEKERLFADRQAYCKIIGNHDLFWKNDPFAQQFIKKMYGCELKIFEGVVLRVQKGQDYLDVFCTHGHQGDAQSDGNAFSKWFVSYVWGPLQAYLEMNTNSPSANTELKTLHNQMMYEWAAQQPKAILVTGHTHQPVFQSLTHLERLYLRLDAAKKAGDHEAIRAIEAEIPVRKLAYDYVHASYASLDPSYFNTGCCCFSGGTITGIEIENGMIRLVKWSYHDGMPRRQVAEEAALDI